MKLPMKMVGDFFSEIDPDFIMKYQNYRETRNKRFPVTADAADKNYLFQTIYNHEVQRDQLKPKKPLSVTSEGFKLMQFCYNLWLLEGIDIIDSNKNVLDLTLSDFYGKSILREPKAFWHIFFEMEVTAVLKAANLEVYPIDESQTKDTSGDILYSEDGKEFIIECKNKRKFTTYESSLQKFATEITDKLWGNYPLGETIEDDSFAIELSCKVDISKQIIDETSNRERLTELIAGASYELIKSKKFESTELRFNGVNLSIKLVGYHNGSYVVEVSDSELETIKSSRDLTSVINPFEHINVKPDVLKENGHGNIQLEFEDNKLIIKQSYAFNLNIPWDIDYQKWIIRTIRDSLEQHKKHSNIIVFIKIPMGIVYQMRNTHVKNHKNKTVSKWDRLKELIIGIFADKKRQDRLVAVVLSTDMLKQNSSRDGTSITLVGAYQAYLNNNLADNIPSGLMSFLDKHEAIGEDFDWSCYFNLGKSF